MHNIYGETRKEVWGWAVMDELTVIREYVEDVPNIKAQIHKTSVVVNKINDRLIVMGSILHGAQHDLRNLKRRAA